MIRLSRTIHFNAGRSLWRPQWTEEKNRAVYGDEGPHGYGHNYDLEVEVEGRTDPQTGMVAWRWSTIPSPKSRGSRRSRVESRCAAAALAKQSVATRDVRAKVRRRIGGGAWGDANEYSIQWNNSRWREEAGRRVYAHPSCAASRRAEGATPTRVVLA